MSAAIERRAIEQARTNYLWIAAQRADALARTERRIYRDTFGGKPYNAADIAATMDGTYELWEAPMNEMLTVLHDACTDCAELVDFGNDHHAFPKWEWCPKHGGTV